MENNTQNQTVIAEQFGYALRVKEILAERISGTPMAFVHTYGCQQNVSDSEKLKGWLCEMGYSFCDSPENADLVLFNTCAVREHAEDRVFGNVGALKKYKKANPNMLIIVCGCMVEQQVASERFKKSFPYVDILMGTRQRHCLPEQIYKRLSGSSRIFKLGGEDKIYEGMPISRDGTFKAWLPIMQGCNNFCTYCIVPYVRGRERSRDHREILKEAKELVRSGVKEIMLLGQNVNSYNGNDGVDFSDLLKMINDIEGDFRIRFMTSHPKDCTEKLLVTMSQCEKVCKSLHLPVQSGSNRILSLMNRKYDTEKYLSLIKMARELMPDIEFTSDIIVGFPGESYEDFCETLKLVKAVEYRALFTFIFSARRGTPAYSMPDIYSEKEKSRWFSELLAAQDEISKKNDAKMLNKTVRVLVEEEFEGMLSGKSEAGANVTFKGTADMIGKFCEVEITETSGSLVGNIK